MRTISAGLARAALSFLIAATAQASWLGIPKSEQKSVEIKQATGVFAPRSSITSTKPPKVMTKTNTVRAAKLQNPKPHISRKSPNEYPNLISGSTSPAPGVTAEIEMEPLSIPDNTTQTTKAQRPRVKHERRLLNVRVFPASALIGSKSLDVNFALSDEFTLGPAIMRNDIHLGIYDETSTNLGARAAWFPQGVFADSFYLSALILYGWGDAAIDMEVIGIDGTFRRTNLDLLAGYQWHWENFNINFALGVNGTATTAKARSAHFFGYRSNSGGAESSGTSGSVTGELGLGFSF